MTNLGPLTTTYKAINGLACQSIYLAKDTEGFWLGRSDKSDDCFPPNFTPIEGYYYSPGICQQGYDYACMTVGVLEPGTTAATCCPSGFTCRPTRSKDDNDACQSILESDSSYIGDVITYHNGDLTETDTTTTLIRAGETVYAGGVPVRRAADDPEWRISSTNLDITMTMTDVLPTSIESTFKSSKWMRFTTDTSTSGGQESSTPSSSGGTEEPSDNSVVQTGLSAGAKAAIGVGATLGLLLFLVAVAAVYYMKQRKRRASPSSQGSTEVVNTEEKLSRQVSRHELEEPVGLHELTAHREPVELG
ncbi:hypothetical protein E0Z10_g8677 [Xylaria hypoxylon]|uniref:Uncharacterized protein n=1 Tax=Xylaria hypoxylon TaxID=37992 RepID=A0A4Z0Y7J8_9PEZI|nr:hypothetical protein E0Z10_g8677 [Xylaria hypoxylon]